jgi:hypothetical protein
MSATVLTARLLGVKQCLSVLFLGFCSLNYEETDEGIREALCLTGELTQIFYCF